jgi:uncharacterized protein
MVTDSDIRTLAARIAEEFRPQRIVLFGSHAHASARPDSDIDLLVIMTVEGPRYRLAARIRASLPVTTPIDVVVRSPEDVRTARAKGDPIVLDAMQTGVVLYPAAA